MGKEGLEAKPIKFPKIKWPDPPKLKDKGFNPKYFNRRLREIKKTIRR